MAVDVCSEISSAGISPRISFSYDLNPTIDSVCVQDCHRRLDSSLLDSDFDFCINTSFVQELSSADELFSNGEIKKHYFVSENIQPKPIPSQPKQISNTDNTEKKKLLKEFLSMSIDEEEKPASKSFWQFKRSNSLNSDNSRSKGIIRSLQFLSRSNSTGSAPNPQKQQVFYNKETQNHKPSLKKQHPVPARKWPPATFDSYNSGQKPPLLRKCGSYGNGVRISPVLNISPPYISRGTVNLFGFGSLLCNGKVRKKKT